MKRTIGRSAAGACALVLLAALPVVAQAQEISLNYDSLSSMEEPLAVETAGVTFRLTGLLDTPVTARLHGPDTGDDIEPGFVGNFQVSAETQLMNRWRVGAAYFGQYATDAVPTFDNEEDYSDNVAGFIGTSFGTVLGGNTSGQVREATRRRRGAGNGVLDFDDFLGGLANWGGAYVGRFGPTVLSAAVDENGDFEAGATFQRPLGRKDYRFSMRVADGRLMAQDGLTRFDTKGVSGVAELVYGASLFDVGGGYERLESRIADADRWFVSAGARTKLGALTLSAEGHYGKAAGDSESAAAAGASYDFARGLSANLGLNYRDADISAGPVPLMIVDEVEAIASLRFSF